LQSSSRKSGRSNKGKASERFDDTEILVPVKRPKNHRTKTTEEAAHLEANESQVYEVEAIKYDKQVIGKGTYYFVKWKGYDDDDNTWEPTSHLPDAQVMVDEFIASKKEAKALHKKDMDQKIAERKAEQLAACMSRSIRTWQRWLGNSWDARHRLRLWNVSLV